MSNFALDSDASTRFKGQAAHHSKQTTILQIKQENTPRFKTEMSPNRRPTIDSACKDLGISRESQNIFLQSLTKFRKKHAFCDGSTGQDLLDWECSRTKERLSSMTLAYLETPDGQGWWPETGISLQAALVYPRDVQL